MRLFVAVPLPDDVASAASALLPELPGLRRVSPELMHLTLAFLGATSDERLADVIAATAAAAAGTRTFIASVDRVGRFQERGRPRVVWLGIGAGADELVAMAQRVRASLTEQRITFDDKPFRAHVTLARVRDDLERDELRAITTAVDRAAPPTGGFRVDHIVVFESVVSSKGPRYTARATVPLASGQR